MPTPAPRYPIKVSIIGNGFSAKTFHIPFILALPSLYKVHSIFQRSPSASITVRIYNDLPALLADPTPTLVIITTPPSTHAEFTRAALNANKHVLCEKPFVSSASEARSLATLAAERGLVLTVYQNRRWDADFLTLQSLLSERRLGRVVDVQTCFDRHRPEMPRADGGKAWKMQKGVEMNGAIWDLGVHLFDQVFVLFGRPERVTGLVGDQRVGVGAGDGGASGNAGSPGGDSFTVLLHYPDGLLVTARAGVVSPEVRQMRWWVRGTEGSWRKFGWDVQEEQLKVGMAPPGDGAGGEGYGVEEKAAWGVVTRIERDGRILEEKVQPGEKGKTYSDFYRQLAGAVKGQEEVPVKVEEVAEVLSLIEVAIRSSDEGKTLVF